MAADSHPHRVRLRLGRHVHAARPAGPGLATACGPVAGPADHRLDDDEQITCPRCKTALQPTT